MISEMKKRLQRRGARRGFTLVELLIVIIIIGILAGAMMLVAGRSRDTAEATRIISDLRTMKSAVLVWLADATVSDATWDNLDNDPIPLNTYLDKPLTAGQDKYKFELGTVKVQRQTGIDSVSGDPVYEQKEEIAWLLGYNLTDVASGVKEHLKSQAQSVGLYGDTSIDLTSTTPPYYNGETTVYVIVK